MSPQAKLNYKGHYRYPNMCNCTKYSVVSSDQWKIFISPTLMKMVDINVGIQSFVENEDLIATNCN